MHASCALSRLRSVVRTAVLRKTARLFVTRPLRSSSSDEPAPEGPAGGWYSAESIDRRLRTRRRRVEGATSGSRSATKLSDEDYYAAAGAPGFTDADLAAPAPERMAHWGAAVGSAAVNVDDDEGDGDGEEEPTSAAAFPADDTPSPTPSPPLPLLRRTSLALPLSSLSGFTAAWALRVAPVFAALPGCLGASVLLHGVPEGAAMPDVLAAARGAARNGGAQLRAEVTSTWASPEAMAAAQADPAYGAAMEALAGFLPPEAAAASTQERWVRLFDVQPLGGGQQRQT